MAINLINCVVNLKEGLLSYKHKSLITFSM